MYTSDDVIRSNIKLHTQLADVYQETEPHYREENVTRVKAILKSLRDQTNGKKLLDIGCGTGFIIDIAKEYFESIWGIDITPAMLERVDTESSSCDIRVQIARSDQLSFDENTFEVATAYAVLHHLHDIQPTLQEVYRVLKPGGVFYSDLDPNGYFWEAISALSSKRKYSDIITREINAVLHKDKEFAEQFDIDKETLELSEPLKHLQGGFKEDDLTEILYAVGFSHTEIIYEWFLGEAKIIHDETTKAAAHIVRTHLREMLPLSRHLFKYISIRARK